MAEDHPSSRAARPWRHRLYEHLANDADGRICTAISEEACRESPGNFVKTLIAQALTNIGDRLASAKTTLPWLLAAAGAPAWCGSMLVPLRESGSMLPQLLIGAWARSLPVRKWLWVIGSVCQGLSLAAMALLSMISTGLTAGLSVLLLLGIFALARGLCSVASKDVMGKTIPKSRRGRLGGWIGGVSGLSALLVGAVLALGNFAQDAMVYAVLLGCGTVLWLIAAWVYATIVEFPGATEGGRNGLREAFASLKVLVSDRPFRHFVLARALAMGSGLAAPLYILLARNDLGGAGFYLGLFIAAEGIASMLSAPIWGRFADRSSRLVFAGSCLLAAVISAAVAAWSWLIEQPSAGVWFYPSAFFVLGIAHAGIRLGRKTYLVDMAEGNQRTTYVAVSNTVIGVLLLFAGGISALASLLSVETAIIMLAVAGVVGSILSWRLPEVSA